MTWPRGTDISAWQHVTPNLDGLDFVFCRAGYGDSPDLRYGLHSSAVRDAGLVLGAYTFGRAGRYNSVKSQVTNLLKVGADADLLALDVEKDADFSYRMTEAEGKEFIARVHDAGRTIGLYHSQSRFPFGLGQDWDWIACWGCPRPKGAEFWQYRGSPLDLDYFIGTRTALFHLAGVTPPDTGTEEPTLDKLKGEDWTAKSIAVLRDRPDRTAAGQIIHHYVGGEKVRSIGELANETGNWRLTEWPLGSGGAAWMLRSDFDPLVQGGDPAVDAGLHDYIARKPDETPYSQAYLDKAKQEAAIIAAALEREQWTTWKAKAPA